MKLFPFLLRITSMVAAALLISCGGGAGGLAPVDSFRSAPGPTTFTVSYFPNADTGIGGTMPTDPNTYPQGAAVTAMGIGTFTYAGYHFAGWNTQIDGEGTAIPAGGHFIMGSASVTLYAQWSTAGFTVTYSGNGSDGGTAPVDPTGYPAGGQATLMGPGDLTHSEDTFAGWNTMANLGGFTYYPQQTVVMNQDLALYAMWTAATTYTVTYDRNGGTGGVPVDANQHIPEFPVYLQYTPVPDGSGGGVFDHWNTAADDSGFSYFSPDDTTFPMPSHNVTLYAIYVFF